ncbi:MFS transporter [Moorella naiadis]|uniref:MFS transporter n=1 Tax=Moorella naiadis (nom. illeg.) TaxID=3093670 RepID=UPI003D9C863F
MNKNAPAAAGWWRYRYLVAAILFFGYSIQYLDRVKTTVLVPLISESLHLTHGDVGNAMFLLMVFYGPTQVLSGFLCDRFGPKKVLVFSLFTWSLFTIYMAFMQNVTEWYIRNALFGILVGTEFVPSARLIARWFPKRERAQAQGILSWSWIVTPAWAPLLATFLAAYFNDWRPVFIWLGLFGLVPLIIVLFFIYDRPEQMRRLSDAEVKESYADELESGILQEGALSRENLAQQAKKAEIPLRDVLLNKSFIAVVISYLACQMTFWGVVTWSPSYLSEVFKFSLTKMGAWASIYFAAGIIGAFLSSRISDKVFSGRRRPMIILSFIGTIPFILLLATVRPGISNMALVLILAGAGFFANMIWGPILAWPADVFSPEMYGRALGFVTGIAYFGAAFAPLIMSRLIMKTAAGVSYTYAWVFIAFCAVLGLIASSLVSDRHETTFHNQAITE